MNNSREIILDKLRKAKAVGATNGLKIRLSQEEASASVFVPAQGDLSEHFKSELEKISGNCFIVENIIEAGQKISERLKEESIDNVYCSENDLAIKLSSIAFTDDPEAVKTCKATITGCEYLIARTGSVMVSNANKSERRPHVAPDLHIVVGLKSQLVPDLIEALQGMMLKYKDKLPSWISNITGPSRTADIEKTLILGAHGPKKLVVFIVGNENS